MSKVFQLSSSIGHREKTVFKIVDVLAVHQTKIDVKVDLLSILLNCVGMCVLDDSQCTSFFLWHSSPATDTQRRHKSKISEKLGRCGKQTMLWPYLKI